MNQSKGFFTISKELAALCINWTDPIHFYTVKDTKDRQDIKPYSHVVTKSIKDSHQVTLYVGNGKAVGKSKVVIYLHCEHNSRFNAVMWKHDFKIDKDLTFEILQVNQKMGCNCCEF